MFRGFGETAGTKGHHDFKFLWLTREPVRLTYQPGTGRLTFERLLPNLAARSPMYQQLRTFIQQRSSRRLPPHRRIDPTRATADCSNRRGRVSVHLTAKKHHHEYAVRKAVNLVHEIFVHLNVAYPEYMWEHFEVSQD